MLGLGKEREREHEGSRQDGAGRTWAGVNVITGLKLSMDKRKTDCFVLKEHVGFGGLRSSKVLQS